MYSRLLCLSGVLIGVSAAPAQTRSIVPASDFAILPWSSVPNNPEMLQGIRECGFNLAGFVQPEALDAVQAAGLQAIVSGLHVNDGADEPEEEVRKRVSAMVERVGSHPAVYGYYLRDEPNASLFPALARYSQAIRQLHPQAKPYINLFPNYANEAQLGSPSYEQHLESFITTVNPPFVSYDHYALMDDGSLRDGYFQNLQAVRKAALAHNLPFWNIVLSNAHFHYAEPSDAGLRFQAFTTLAYGARGISYFTYITPHHGNYRLAPIDQFGHKTPVWDMLRNVNLQINALAPTLVKLRSLNVFHHPDVPSGSTGLGDSKHVAQITGDGRFVVGEFEDAQGKPYVMLVNKDLHRSTALGVQFKQPGGLVWVSNYTGRTQAWRGESLWLAAGQGVLLTTQK